MQVSLFKQFISLSNFRSVMNEVKTNHANERMAKMRERSGAIIWAVDPFVEDLSRQRSAARAVRAAAANRASPVEPVYVFDPLSLDAPIAALSEVQEQILASAAELLSRTTHRVKLPRLLPLKILSEPTGSAYRAAQALARYAVETKASMIVVSSQARKGLPRWVMGSFAESLVMCSPVPVLVVNPSVRRQYAFPGRILFPTDFSEGSRSVYDNVLAYAASKGCEVTLFHKVRYDLHALTEAASRHPEVTSKVEEIYKKLIQCRKQDLAKWAEIGRARGVKVSSQLDFRMSGGIADSVLKFAGKKFDIIALASTSSRVSTMILGSVSRRLVRESACPVWVWRPDAGSESAKTQGAA